MNVVSFESFRDDWAKKLISKWSEEEQFCIYIANPFCRKICRFCMYKSSALSKERYEQYYGRYLPNLIHLLSPIIAKRIPDTVYFGGGTSSLMDTATMRVIFQSIPHLHQTTYKCFEANPASMSKEKIDVLSEYGFTEISLGVQTFNSAMLAFQGRETATLQEIAELVAYATSCGIFVNIDLLTNYESDDAENVTRLKNDLTLAAQQIRPGKLTVYPRYETYFRADKARRVRQIKDIRNTLRSFCDHSNYYVTPELLRVDSDEDILSYGILDYHVYNRNSIVNAPHTRYNCSGPGYFKKPQNVLGLGGFAKQIPYSYIWGQKQWYMVNQNWNPILIEAPFNDTTPLDMSFLSNEITV